MKGPSFFFPKSAGVLQIDEEDKHWIAGGWRRKKHGHVWVIHPVTEMEVRMDRLIMKAEGNEIVLHLDHDSLNLKKSNLQIVSQASRTNSDIDWRAK